MEVRFLPGAPEESGPLAQQVEHLTLNQGVAGSSPARPTSDWQRGSPTSHLEAMSQKGMDIVYYGRRALARNFHLKEVENIEREPVLVRNEQIRFSKVRVIDPEGKQLGIMPTSEALNVARQKGLDLVLVSPNADPPVARIMDFGKYKYRISKRHKEAKRRQKQQEIKQMKFRLKIDEHDYQTKVRHIKRFLNDGNKVKVTIMFRGREMAFTDKGKEILQRIANDLEDMAVVEKSPLLEGRDMWMTLKPKSE